MDEVRSPKLGVRVSAPDQISTDRIGAARTSMSMPGRPFSRRPAIDPFFVNLCVVAAVLTVAVGLTLYIWHDVGAPGLAERPPAAIAQVQEIEQLLSDLGFAPGTIDGVMDADTAEAIRAFQQAAGLPEDGQPSPALLEELKAVAGQ